MALSALDALRYVTGPPPQQQPVRNLQMQSGNPASIMQASQQQARGVAQNVPNVSQQFGSALMELLKRHQQLGTAGFAKQGFDAQAAQNARVSQETPSSLIGASPGQQASARSASALALDPTISGARSAQQTFGEQLGAFRNAVSDARQYMKDVEAEEETRRQRASEIVELAISQGSTALDELLRTSPDLFKKAGYNTKEFEAVLKGMRTKEAEDARRFAVTQQTKTDPALTAAQKSARDTVNSVLTSLDDYSALYNSLVGSGGRELFGEDAAKLAGAYNALIFQIAQAAGTGALQAADREVVEQMIPNPTSISGAIGATIRGGKQGSISGIAEARKLFVNRLNSIGSDSSGASTSGTIRVREKATGRTGSLPADEFDPAVYERI